MVVVRASRHADDQAYSAGELFDEARRQTHADHVREFCRVSGAVALVEGVPERRQADLVAKKSLRPAAPELS